MPDFEDVTIFGSGQSIGSDFEGTYYDTKRDRQGRSLPLDISGSTWRAACHEFLVRGWDTSVFSRYYRAPKKLYATNFVVPITYSSVAPEAFGDEEGEGAFWMVHYKGQLVHKEDITFRLWGMSDEFMAVRVNGEMPFAFSWPDHPEVIGNLWETSSAKSRQYWMGSHKAVVGDWITLEAGVPKEMEILMGDNGGFACFFLSVEVKG